MGKIVVIFMLVIAGVIPVYAQQSQQAPLPLIAPDLLDRANQSLNARDYQKAVYDLSLFILLNPTFSPAYYGRAQANFGLSDFESALHDVNRALETAYDLWAAEYSASLYSLRAQIDQRQQHIDDALNDYTQSITIQPSVEAFASRGMLHLSNNDPRSAHDDLNSAVDLDASNPVLYVYRGLVNALLQDQQASGTDYLHFFSLIQTNPVNHAEIEPGQVVSLEVDRGVVFIVPFTGKSGQYASALAVGRSGNVDPLIVLLDAQGNPLAGDDDGGGSTSALILDYHLPTDGRYALVVGHSLGGFTGQVILQLQVADMPSQ